MASLMLRYYAHTLLRYEAGLMTDPSELRPALIDLLQTTERRDSEGASCQAKKLINDLEASFAPPDPLAREYRPSAVRFSGLYYALLRELRGAERHIASGDWTAASKAMRQAILLLPEPQTFRQPGRPLPN